MGRNAKYPCIGISNAIDARGAVSHDEIGFRIGVPCPKGVAADNQVVNEDRLSWIDTVGAITTFPLGCDLI